MQPVVPYGGWGWRQEAQKQLAFVKHARSCASSVSFPLNPPKTPPPRQTQTSFRKTRNGEGKSKWFLSYCLSLVWTWVHPTHGIISKICEGMFLTPGNVWASWNFRNDGLVGYLCVYVCVWMHVCLIGWINEWKPRGLWEAELFNKIDHGRYGTKSLLICYLFWLSCRK